MLNKLTKMVTAHPVITIAITLILTCFFFYGLTKLNFLNDVKKMLPEGNPVVTTFEEVDETFGGADFIMLALESDDIFTYQTLNQIEYLTEEIENLEWVSGVRSIINAGKIQGMEDVIEVVDLIEEIPPGKEELKELKDRVLSDEDYAGNIISEDGKVAAIVIQLQTDADKTRLIGEINTVIKNAKIKGKTYLMGTPVTEDYIARVVKDDMGKLIPFVILVVIIILFISFRNLQGILLPLLVVIISTIWALGLMGFVGVPLSNVSNILPIVLISVGTAYVIHILSHHREEFTPAGGSSKETTEKIMSAVGIAIFFAGITTMAGFAANIFSPLRPIKETGIFTAFGVGAALLSSITFVPAILSLKKNLKNKVKKTPGRIKDGLLQLLLKRLSFVTVKIPWVILLLAGLLCILALIYIPKLNIESDLMSFYKPDSQPVKAFNLMKEKFGGSDVIQVLVKGDIQDPEVLKSMEQFQNEIEKIEIIRRPYSLVNVLKDVNEALNEGNSEYKVLPSTKEEAAQFLLLLSMGGAENLDKIISFDYDQGLITARVAGGSGEERKVMIKNIEETISKNFDGGKAKAVVTGMPVLEQAINELIVKGQLKSLAFAILFVLLLMIIVTRSFAYGTICTIPIALTVLLNFGVMSFLKVPLDVATSMIACVAIGIGVDYSIHFFNRYRLEKKEGKTKNEAIQTTITTTGKAIIFNATAVGFGFLVLTFSSFPPLRNFGWLIALTMVFSSGGALTILPTLLLLKDKK